MRANISSGASAEPLTGPPARRPRAVPSGDLGDGFGLKGAAKVLVKLIGLPTADQQPTTAGVSRQR